MIDLATFDRIAHDPLQTHLPEFAGGRGPYPGHAAEGADPPRSNPTPRGRRTGKEGPQ